MSGIEDVSDVLLRRAKATIAETFMLVNDSGWSREDHDQWGDEMK